MKKLLFLTAIFFIGITTYSQTFQKSFASLGGVVSIPVGNISEGWGIGFNVHGNAGYVFHKNVAARVDLQYNTFPYKESGDYSGYSLKSTSIMADVMVGSFGKEADIKPYGLVGMGLYLNSVSDMKYQGVTYFSGNSETNFGMKIGGGVAFKVSPKLSLFGETSFNIIFGGGTANYLPVKVGATLNF